MFAKAQGIFAKTDRLDARVLALFAALMAPSARPPAPQALTELAELVTARMTAVGAQTALKNQRSAATVKFLQRHPQAHQGRRGPRPPLRHPDFDTRLRFRHRGRPDRLSRRARQHHRQTERHARRPCSDRRSVGQT
jgi:hypothetical protein